MTSKKVASKRSRASKAKSLSTDELRDLSDVAIRFHELGQSVDLIADDYQVDPTTIRRWIAKAQKLGIVWVYVTPFAVEVEQLRIIKQQLRDAFSIMEVELVPGRADLLDISEGPAKEALVLSVAQATARFLEDKLSNRDILLVPWGRMTSYISNQLRSPRPLPDFKVVPMVGVLGVEDDTFEANILAAKFAALFGGHSIQMPAPVVVPKPMSEEIWKWKQMKRVRSLYEQATVAITTVAAPNPETSSVVRYGLLTKKEVEILRQQGAVGEIASYWWYDQRGNVVEGKSNHAVGLGLRGQADMVQRNQRVIAVVGASRERIRPLKIALEHNLVNCLITDHITALELLKMAHQDEEEWA